MRDLPCCQEEVYAECGSRWMSNRNIADRTWAYAHPYSHLCRGHLEALVRKGLVERRKSGIYVFYRRAKS